MTTILLQIVLGLLALILLLALGLGLWLIPKALRGAGEANARFEEKRRQFDKDFEERAARVKADLRKPF